MRGRPLKSRSWDLKARSTSFTSANSTCAENRETVRQKKIEEFRERFANPYVAADRGYVDAVIQPRETRKKLIQALAMLETKRDKNPPKKHGNIPL